MILLGLFSLFSFMQVLHPKLPFFVTHLSLEMTRPDQLNNAGPNTAWEREV